MEKKVLQGPLVEMRRPSATIWPGTGRLAGIIFLSNAMSGWYELTIGEVRKRKNASVAALSLLPEVVSLQYSNLRIEAPGAITISMPEDRKALMRLAPDTSHMERVPDQVFAQQALSIVGLMLWRGPSGVTRLTEALDHGRLICFRRLVEFYKRIEPPIRRLRKSISRT